MDWWFVGTMVGIAGWLSWWIERGARKRLERERAVRCAHLNAVSEWTRELDPHVRLALEIVREEAP